MTGDPRRKDWKYTTIRPHQYSHDPVMDKYAPQHRMGYRKRTSIITGNSQYMPYCICGDWIGKWRGSRNEISRREYTTLHLVEVGRQPHLLPPTG